MTSGGATISVLAMLALAEPTNDAATVALAPLETAGETDPTDLEAIDARMQDAFATERFNIIRLTDACDDDACWQAAAQREGATFVIRPKMRQQEADHTVTIAVLGLDGATVSSAEGACDLCGRDELLDLVGDLSSKARRSVERLVTGGVLAITSAPSGATVSVDGETIGTTPLEHTAVPGPHEIQLELPGHHVASRSTDVVGGTREEFRFSLVPIPKVAPPPTAPPQVDRPPAGRALVTSGAALLAAGLVGVGVGAALVALHARPVRNACGGSDVDPDGDCRFLHDTRGGGIAAIVLGSAGVIAGAVLVGLGVRRARSRRSPGGMVARF